MGSDSGNCAPAILSALPAAHLHCRPSHAAMLGKEDDETRTIKRYVASGLPHQPAHPTH